jgi:hypothetical protein
MVFVLNMKSRNDEKPQYLSFIASINRNVNYFEIAGLEFDANFSPEYLSIAAIEFATECPIQPTLPLLNSFCLLAKSLFNRCSSIAPKFLPLYEKEMKLWESTLIQFLIHISVNYESSKELEKILQAVEYFHKTLYIELLHRERDFISFMMKVCLMFNSLCRGCVYNFSFHAEMRFKNH